MKTILSVLILVFGVTSFAGGTAKGANSRKPANSGDAADAQMIATYPVHMNASCRYIPKNQVNKTKLQSPGLSASNSNIRGEKQALFCSVDIEPALQLKGQGAPAAATAHPAVPIPERVDAECNLIQRKSEQNLDLAGATANCPSERFAYSVYDDEGTKKNKDDIIFFCCQIQDNN